MTKEQISYSQCPGECYSEFWEEKNKESHFDVGEHTQGKTYDETLNKWVGQTTQCRIDYYYKNDFERRWKYCNTMPMAIAAAKLMIEKGDYTIVSITTDYFDIAQD